MHSTPLVDRLSRRVQPVALGKRRSAVWQFRPITRDKALERADPRRRWRGLAGTRAKTDTKTGGSARCVQCTSMQYILLNIQMLHELFLPFRGATRIVRTGGVGCLRRRRLGAAGGSVASRSRLGV